MPGMLERDWGRIIFIAFESGLNLPKEMIRYEMTKTAQLAVARGLAELTAGTGVTVNSVLSGPTLSSGVEGFLAAVAKDASVPVDDPDLRQGARPVLAHSAICHRRGRGQHGGLCNLERGFGQQWCGAAR